MDQVLTVVQNTFAQTTDREALRAYYEHIWKEREAVPGYLGGMVWSDVEEPLSLLAIHRYRDVAAADLGAQVTAKASLMAERDRLPSEPTNVIRVRTTHDYGTLRESLGKAPYLSYSLRIAEPGRGEELQEDLKQVFVESVLIPGFVGFVIGVNAALEEEVLGFAGWESEAAFRASIPEGIIPSVKLYGPAWAR